jgi:hypothetical protein
MYVYTYYVYALIVYKLLYEHVYEYELAEASVLYHVSACALQPCAVDAVASLQNQEVKCAHYCC